ncbi:phosphopantetheine-binding protein [Eubacterium sp.]|uniref:phosphopantetheine-binding protein n=1 Tax=Eubacterium sp. TaxID=142586 RepID=UPI003520C1C2
MQERIIKVLDETVGSQLTKGVNEIGLEANLFDYGLDSIGFINIIIGIENEFDIFIDQDDLDIDTFSTIKDIINYLKKRLEEK